MMFSPIYKKRKKGVCENQFEDIGVLLQMVLDKHHITEDMTLQTLTEKFADIVGNLLIEHTKIANFSKGILTLKCANSVWKQELFMQKKAIIDKCNLVLGKFCVNDIRFV